MPVPWSHTDAPLRSDDGVQLGLWGGRTQADEWAVRAVARGQPYIAPVIAGKMFLTSMNRSGSAGNGAPDYEPDVRQSFYVRARQRGITALEALYDHLAEGDGSQLIYFPLFNYAEGNLDVVHQLHQHPRVRPRQQRRHRDPPPRRPLEPRHRRREAPGRR